MTKVPMCHWHRSASDAVKGWLRSTAVLLSLCLLAGTGPVQAHRLQTVFTTIELNPRTGMMEVIHRCSLHDLTHLMTPAQQSRGGLDDLRTRAELALLMSSEFDLRDAAGKPMPLQLIGAEIDAGDFWVYQEIPAESLPDTLQVRHDMLRDTWPDITNYLNVHYPEGIQSLTFGETSGLLAVSRPAH